MLALIQSAKASLRHVSVPKRSRKMKNGLQIDAEAVVGREPLDQEQAAELSSMMPHLAGQPLQPPQFLKVHWTVGRTFSERDDPDRMQDAWELPLFVRSHDPKVQRAQTTVEELQVPYGKPGSRFARVVHKALSEEACVEVLEKINSKKFTPALVNIGSGMQQFRPEYRDGHRAIVDSPELAAWFLDVIRPYLPEQLEDGSRLVELNERLRVLCYTPGQFFEEHQDGMYFRRNGHPRAGDRSKVTVQIYLHDIPDKYGGATTFFPNTMNSVKHQPEAGSVLLFTQDLLHEGSLVTEGIKYTIRTEAMYGPPSRDSR